MPLYTPDDPEFASLEARHRWFDAVLQAECGELLGDEDGAPAALNWLDLVPPSRALDLVECECSLAYVGDSGYACTIWDATGEEDEPWAVFVVDDAGPRWLSEYSLFDEDADEAALEATLEKASAELPARLEAGDFDRPAPPVPIPDWLARPVERPIEGI